MEGGRWAGCIVSAYWVVGWLVRRYCSSSWIGKHASKRATASHCRRSYFDALGWGSRLVGSGGICVVASSSQVKTRLEDADRSGKEPRLVSPSLAYTRIQSSEPRMRARWKV
ncbi:hypothetical protein DL98DRAFT_84404 [Cadophora sp. DSE1049]|nr:hypothetical protein DL98DRAFT_84404 [Cadophora sp. DSE1049]